MKKSLLLVFIILSFFTQSFYAIKIEYKFNINDNYEIETNVQSRYYINGEFLKENKITELTNYFIKSVSSDFAEISASTIISEQKKVFGKTNNIIKQKLSYNFQKNSKGEIKDPSAVSGINNFPMLPYEDIKINDIWNNTSIIKIAVLNYSDVINLDADVQYKLISIENNNGAPVGLISADMTFPIDKNKDKLNERQIFKITGFGNYLIKFDINNGRVLSINETFDYIIFLYDYRIIEIAGSSFSLFK